MEEKITYTSDGIEIEGLLKEVSEKGVIATHPHPQYGGNMYNPVVETIVEAFDKHGFTTLRFNFRGVGKSQGTYDDGIGELRDVYNAFTFLTQRGIHKLYLAGYSFGAWVNAHISHTDAACAEMIMVSPPVALMDFTFLKNLPGLKLVVSGSRDEIAPADQLAKMLPDWNPDATVEIIPGADHFYSGSLDALSTVLDTYIRPA
jgi:alpha/beta superfamily hydrolase